MKTRFGSHSLLFSNDSCASTSLLLTTTIPTFKVNKTNSRLGVLVHTCNSTIWEAEAGGGGRKILSLMQAWVTQQDHGSKNKNEKQQKTKQNKKTTNLTT
jgi:hypothetical protein